MILRASSLLFSLQGCAADVVDMIPTIILLARLREGPNTEWDTTDRELLLIFGKGDNMVPLFNHSMLIQVIGQESWGDDGDILRVCILLADI